MQGAEVPLDSPIVCPTTIGRAAHLAAIDRLLDNLVAGRGQTLLIAGEAGIGKSRLVAETKARAVDRGLSIRVGQCFETDRALPYAPFLELLPEPFGEQMHGASAAIDSEQHKRRLFQALIGVVRELTAEHPLLLVVEDVHWADETSLELLRFLARAASQERLVLVLTYRSDEVNANPGLRALLTAFDRERLTVELRVQRLTRDELDAMLRAIFGLARATRSEFLDLLYGLTEGNPFFVEEVLRALVGAGDIFVHDGAWDRKPIADLRVPRSVEDAVQRRTILLSDTARKVVEVAAVAGRRFDFDLLAELTGLEEHALVGLVKELIGAGLMVEEADDQLAFRHALTRQAIYSGLLTRERRALHRQVAEALERLGTSHADESAAELAFHYAEAHQWQAALPYARQAGERALRMYAPRAAVEQLTRAIDAARALSVAPEPEVFRLRGEAYELLGDFDAARGDLETAIASARAAGDRRVEWQALLDLSLLWAGRDYEHTGAYANQALELARTIDDPSLTAQTMNRIGNWHMNRDNLPESLRYHQEALSLFEQLGDERGRAETLDLLGMASSTMAGRSAAYYADAIPLLRRLDDRPRLVTSLIMRMLANGAYLYETSPVGVVPEDEAIALGDEALRIVHDINWPAGESFVRWELALWLAPRGEYTRALRSAQAGLDLATEIGHRQWMAAARATLGLIYWDICAFESAESLLAAALEVAREIGSRNFSHLALGGLASVHAGQRRFADARSLLDEALGAGAAPETAGLRFCWMVRAELALAHNDAQQALEITDTLSQTTEPGVATRVWHARGEALAQLGHGSEAVEVLEQARATARAQSARGRLWRVELSLARALRSVGRREDAERVVASVRTTLEDLAAAIEDDQLRSGFERATSRLIPAAATVSPARAAKRRFGGLTTRERQVARLIANGLSNRAIADELILGERTVESYVANILSKLGFNARTQIAAWVVETGLAEVHD